MIKRIIIGILFIILLAFGWVVYRIYPRHVALSLKGLEYKLGTAGFATQPVTLQMNGKLRTGLRGQQTFTGIVNVIGSTIPDRGDGKTLTINFHSDLTGGELTYFNWKTHMFYSYGSVFTNPRFDEFTIMVFQPNGSGWNSQNGLMISAPARNRSQALEISNTLMKTALHGHPLQ